MQEIEADMLIALRAVLFQRYKRVLELLRLQMDEDEHTTVPAEGFREVNHIILNTDLNANSGGPSERKLNTRLK